MLKTRMSHLRVGNPLDKAVDMGAVVDQSQLDTIGEYVEEARAEGAEVCLRTFTFPPLLFFLFYHL